MTALSPCPALDRLVDDAMADLPGAAARLSAHAAACPACAAEALLADEPTDVPDVLDCLRGTPAPASVVEAALAEARRGRPARAADRAPERGTPARSTRRVWSIVAASAAALALALVVLTQIRTDSIVPEAPLVAEQTRPDAPTPPVVESEPTPEAPIETPVPRPEPAAKAPRATHPPQPAPRPAQAPQVPPHVQPVAPTPDERLAAAPTPADTAAARADLMLAFRIVGRAQQAADDAVAAEMRRVGEALAPTRIL